MVLGYYTIIFFFNMKSSSLLLLASCFLGATAKATQTDMKKRVAVDDGKIVLHQVCNSGMDNTEVSSLKKAVEMIKERLDKNEAKGKGAICWFINL